MREMKRILNALAFISFGLLSANAFADDINFLLSNRVDIAQGSGRPQVLFIIDVLKQSAVTKTGEVTSEGWQNVTEASPGTFAVADVATTPLLIQYPNDISFTGNFIGTNGSLSYRYYEVSKSSYDEIVTKDPREIVKYIMRTRPDLEYGVIALNTYSDPDSYLTSAKLYVEVDYRADVTTTFGTISGITSHLVDSTPIIGGLSYAYDYLSGQLDDGSNSNTNYASPLNNDCSDVKLILITNGGWTNDITYQSQLNNPPLYTAISAVASSEGDYLEKITDHFKNNVIKSGCSARVSTSVYGVDAPVTENLFKDLEPVGKKMADAGEGLFLNASTGGEIVRSILDDLDHSYPDPLSLSSPSVAIAVNRAAHKSTAFATAFEPLKTQRWFGNITDKNLSDSTDTTLDPVGSEAAGAKTFANGFITTKTAVSRVIKTNINSTTLRDLSGIVGTAETTISLADYNGYVQDLPGGLADPIHFKPLAIDYGGSIGTRLVIGTNDGLLHMFDSSGNELWAFLPKELEKLVPALVNGNTAPTYMMVDHFYGVDGAPTAFVYDAPDSDGLRDGAISFAEGSKDKVFLYFGLRRGGGTYYAMDITDPTTPSVLWTKGSMNIDYGGKFDVGITNSQKENETPGETVITEVEATGSGCPVFATFFENGAISSLIMGVCKDSSTRWCLWKYGDYTKGNFTGEVLLDGNAPSTYSKQEPSFGVYAYYNSATDYGFTQQNQCVMDLSHVDKFTFDAHPIAMYSFEVTNDEKNSTCSSSYFTSNANNMLLGKDSGSNNSEIILGFDITSIPHDAHITSARISLVHSSDGESERDIYDGVVAIHGVNGFFGEAPGRNAYSTQDCTDKDAYYADYAHVYKYLGAVGDPGVYDQARTLDGNIFPEDIYGEFYDEAGEINAKGIAALTKLFKSSSLHDAKHGIAWAQFKLQVVDPSGIAASQGAIFETPTGGPQIERQMYGEGYWDNVVPKLELTWTYDDPQGAVTDSEMEKTVKEFWEVRGSGDLGGTPDANGCITAINTAHAEAGRAELADVVLYYAVGSGDALNIGSAKTSIKETSTGYWKKVDSCAETVTTYTVTITDGSNGTVSTNSKTVNTGETTSFTITPDTGYEAAVNSGCGGSLIDGTYTTGAVSADCSISVSFSAVSASTYSLNVGISGSGTVTGTGIDCGADCTETVDEGANIELTATADTGYQFDSWSGGCSGSGTCSVTLNSNQSVTANFSDAAVQNDLTVTVSGSGTVTATGINCGSDCTGSYADGASVTLSATADTGYQFDSWSGACSGSGACSVTMNSNQNVTATFEAIPAASSCDALSSVIKCSVMFGLDTSDKTEQNLAGCTYTFDLVYPSSGGGYNEYTCSNGQVGESCYFRQGNSSGNVSNDETYTHQKDNKYYKSEATCQAAP